MTTLPGRCYEVEQKNCQIAKHVRNKMGAWQNYILKPRSRFDELENYELIVIHMNPSGGWCCQFARHGFTGVVAFHAEKTLEPFRTHPKLQSPTCFFHFRLPGIWFFSRLQALSDGQEASTKVEQSSCRFQVCKGHTFCKFTNIDSQNASVFCWKEMRKVPKTPSNFFCRVPVWHWNFHRAL